jgi:methylated-DNA-protein-cysteine methyltransferase-like protein
VSGHALEEPEPPAPTFLEVVAAIPTGSVATYGDVARLAGRPRAAREVGWALSGLPDGSDVPWWRVVNRFGRIPPRPSAAEQAELLRAEGVPVNAEGCLDLQRYRWDGEFSA